MVLAGTCSSVTPINPRTLTVQFLMFIYWAEVGMIKRDSWGHGDGFMKDKWLWKHLPRKAAMHVLELHNSSGSPILFVIPLEDFTTVRVLVRAAFKFYKVLQDFTPSLILLLLLHMSWKNVAWAKMQVTPEWSMHMARLRLKPSQAPTHLAHGIHR